MDNIDFLSETKKRRREVDADDSQKYSNIEESLGIEIKDKSKRKDKKRKEKKKEKKKSKKHKKHKRTDDKKVEDEKISKTSTSVLESSSSSSSSDDDTPRSIITGKKIKMSREITLQDRLYEIERAAKRHFMNS